MSSCTIILVTLLAAGHLVASAPMQPVQPVKGTDHSAKGAPTGFPTSFPTGLPPGFPTAFPSGWAPTGGGPLPTEVPGAALPTGSPTFRVVKKDSKGEKNETSADCKLKGPKQLPESPSTETPSTADTVSDAPTTRRKARNAGSAPYPKPESDSKEPGGFAHPSGGSAASTGGKPKPTKSSKSTGKPDEKDTRAAPTGGVTPPKGAVPTGGKPTKPTGGFTPPEGAVPSGGASKPTKASKSKPTGKPTGKPAKKEARSPLEDGVSPPEGAVPTGEIATKPSVSKPTGGFTPPEGAVPTGVASKPTKTSKSKPTGKPTGKPTSKPAKKPANKNARAALIDDVTSPVGAVPTGGNPTKFTGGISPPEGAVPSGINSTLTTSFKPTATPAKKDARSPPDDDSITFTITKSAMRTGGAAAPTEAPFPFEHPGGNMTTQAVPGSS